MQFLRTLFWVIVAVIAVIFSLRNWTAVTIHLWGGIDADVKLPVMLLAAFLIGLAPMFILHRATRWSLRRRLDTAERALAIHAAPPVEPLSVDASPPSPAVVPVPPVIA